MIDGDFPDRAVPARSATSTSCSTASACTTASRSSAACRCAEDDRLDWQANGEARHVGVRLENGVRIENVYVPAGGDVPDRDVNPKFGQKLDFVERMTRLVGDARRADAAGRRFQYRAAANATCGATSSCSNVVSHTPIEVEALDRLKAVERLGRSRPALPSRAGAAASPGGAIARPTGPRTIAAAGSTICGRPPTSPRKAVSHTVFEELPQLAEAIGPCADHDRVRVVTRAARPQPRARDRRAAARLADRDSPATTATLALLPIETADAGRLAAFDPDERAPVLLSAGRAATLKLANQRDAADARCAGADRARAVARFRYRRRRSPIRSSISPRR